MLLHHPTDDNHQPAPEPGAGESSFISETMAGQIVRDSVRRRVPVSTIADEVRAQAGPQPLSELPHQLRNERPGLLTRIAAIFRRSGK